MCCTGDMQMVFTADITVATSGTPVVVSPPVKCDAMIVRSKLSNAAAVMMYVGMRPGMEIKVSDPAYRGLWVQGSPTFEVQRGEQYTFPVAMSSDVFLDSNTSGAVATVIGLSRKDVVNGL